VSRGRRLLAQYEDMAELIRLGAYRQGTDPGVDEAIHYQPALEQFLAQRKDERAPLAEGYRDLAAMLGMDPPEA
jgi:flagellum-specific ATP synthase